MAQRSSELMLYAGEDVSDASKLFKIDVANAQVEFSCAQDMKFDGAVKFKDSGDQYFDISTKCEALQTEVDAAEAAHATDLATLQAADAAESNARASADTGLQNAVDAEVAARVTAVGTVTTNLAAQVVAQQANHATAIAGTAAEEASRIAAVAAEAALRVSDVSGLQAQISALLANTDSTALNSLQEIVTAYQQGDTTLASQAATMIARLGVIEGILNEALNAGI